MSNISSRAYDAAEAPKDSRFYAKCDGERLWLSRIGCAWVTSRRNLEHKIVSVSLDEGSHYCEDRKVGPLLEIEYIVGYGSIFLDVLMDHEGNTAKASRNMEDVQETFRKVKTQFPYLEYITVRELFQELKEAQDKLSSLPFPCDGLVAVPRHGIDVKKIKEEKSVELRLNEDNTLETSDGRKLFRMNDKTNRGKVGDIYEIRLKIVHGSLITKRVIRRPDKVVPNSYDAVRNIVLSAKSVPTKFEVRTELWRWSNLLRETIYSKAFSIDNRKRIVLDIGSGDGQSSDEYLRNKHCTYILLEKDEQKCKRLCARLGTRRTSKDPRALIPAMSSMREGRCKHFVLNCTLTNFLHDEVASKIIINEIRCCVACFSAQFVVEDLNFLASVGILVVGCCYLYDCQIRD